MNLRTKSKNRDRSEPSTAVVITYQCTVCGYVYNPAEGESFSGIAPGTKYEELPDDWTCLVCSAPKSAFQPQA